MKKKGNIIGCDKCEFFFNVKRQEKSESIPVAFLCINPDISTEFMHFKTLPDLIVNGIFPEWCPLEDTEED